MEDNSPTKLSTSALAKALHVPSQQLFSILKDYGWIRKLEEGWALSTKGEFEGGEYVHSKRFGRYIVWPEDLTEHPLFIALEDNRHTSATALGKIVGITAREVNRILAELGWIKHGLQGWELTGLGEQQGGSQLENENSGTFYIVWPQTVQNNTILKQQLQLTKTIKEPINLGGNDLFSEQERYKSLDGHEHNCRYHLQVCHWLYHAALAHACQRRLPIDNNLVADFYLPAHQVYIECWVDGRSTDLSQRMKRKELYEQYDLAVIDLEKEDFQHLDDVLTRQLRRHGVKVF